MAQVVDHEHADCDRPGRVETYYSLNQNENHTHRAGIVKFFVALIRTYITEIEAYYEKLLVEIMDRTHGRASVRASALAMCYTSHDLIIEKYSLSLQRSLLDYHSRLIDYDDTFSENAMTINEEQCSQSPEEIEAAITLKYDKRKRVCKTMFLEQLQAMRRIREETRVLWEQERTVNAVETEIDPIVTVVDTYNNTEMTLATPLILMWSH